MKLIGYLDFMTVKMEKPYDKDFNISGDFTGTTGKNCSLILRSAGKEHSALYYCLASKAQCLNFLSANTKTTLTGPSQPATPDLML